MDVSKDEELSSEADLEVKLTDEGKAELSFDYEGKLGGAKLTVYTDAVKLVDKITDLIPGEWDDKLLDSLAEKLLAKKTGE